MYLLSSTPKEESSKAVQNVNIKKTPTASQVAALLFAISLKSCTVSGIQTDSTNTC